MDSRYRIRPGTSDDIDALPEIERAANNLFAEFGWPADILASVTDRDTFRDFQRAGRLWVATDAHDQPVGFALASLLDDHAHLDEIDVHPDHGRRGIGRALVEHVCTWAADSALRAVTLTTERDIPGNAPFYARLGFVAVPDAELSAALRAIVAEETSRGLAPDSRVAMIRHLLPFEQ